MKVSFSTILRYWANLYSVDNTNSLIDFVLVGEQVSKRVLCEGCSIGFFCSLACFPLALPFRIPPIYCEVTFGPLF